MRDLPLRALALRVAPLPLAASLLLACPAKPVAAPTSPAAHPLAAARAGLKAYAQWESATRAAEAWAAGLPAAAGDAGFDPAPGPGEQVQARLDFVGGGRLVRLKRDAAGTRTIAYTPAGEAFREHTERPATAAGEGLWTLAVAGPAGARLACEAALTRTTDGLTGFALRAGALTGPGGRVKLSISQLQRDPGAARLRFTHEMTPGNLSIDGDAQLAADEAPGPASSFRPLADRAGEAACVDATGKLVFTLRLSPVAGGLKRQLVLPDGLNVTWPVGADALAPALLSRNGKEIGSVAVTAGATSLAFQLTEKGGGPPLRVGADLGGGDGQAAAEAPRAATAAVAWIAGSGQPGYAKGGDGLAQAQFQAPSGLYVDASHLYVADSGNHRIRRLTYRRLAAGEPDAPGTIQAGAVRFQFGPAEDFAGDGVAGRVDGPRALAQLNRPLAMVPDGEGGLYLLDAGNHAVRRIARDGRVSLVAGRYEAAFNDGPGATAAFDSPDGLVRTPDGSLYVADSRNHRIRRIDPQAAGQPVSTAIDLLALAGADPAWQEPTGLALRGDHPSAVPSGQRLWLGARTSGSLWSVGLAAAEPPRAEAGAGPGFDDGPGASATLGAPAGYLAWPAAGGLVFSDPAAHRLRVWGDDGTVRTLAGSGEPGRGAGAASQARFMAPAGLALLAPDAAVVADRDGHALALVVLGEPTGN